MRWVEGVVATVALVLPASPVRADGGAFVSAGVYVSHGTRGFALGVEASSGWIDEKWLYAGGAVGVDVASSAPKGTPGGRVYVEGELGFLCFGVGFGPASFFDDASDGPHFQVTPYLAFPSGGDDSLLVFAPFYRFTTNGDDGGLHEGGLAVKAQWRSQGASHLVGDRAIGDATFSDAAQVIRALHL